ncbi:MAG: cation:proton antiporter [Gammaproteobacteria bacterium]|nr:cation:proton antiporter [Gammaproteobacteria bacterium]
MHAAAPIAELVTTVVVLLLVSALTLALSRRWRLPFTVLLVVVGVLLGLLADHGPAVLRPLAEHDISPDVILFVFLPTLIFESAFNLDARLVRRNLAPILTLAVPGLLLSTAIIGGLLAATTPFGLVAALLLGAILSATDPVAVVALFRQLGAPQRLTVLVEGESLFNDATSLVVAGLLVGVLGASQVDAGTVFGGMVRFFVVFTGGIVVGWIAALLCGWVLGRCHGDGPIEITLTTILAYLSFLVAEELFHVSGVMAVVAAGMTLGGWGRLKISPSVRGYLEHFWEYLAFVANALIFLLVGLRVDLQALGGALDLLLVVVLAMLLARAAVIYGLLPLLGNLSAGGQVRLPYRHVMFWGGLRGAVALAIVLSLPAIPEAETFVALVMGAVLFTLLAQGLTIERLVRHLGLDRPPLADRLAREEGQLAAKRLALSRIPELQRGGLFSARIARQLQDDYEAARDRLEQAIERLRRSELDAPRELQLLFLRSLALERAHYLDSYDRGHLSERACRDLIHSVDTQAEGLRHRGELPEYTLHPPHESLTELGLRWLRRLVSDTPLAERRTTSLVAYEYEEAWGRYQGSLRVLDDLERVASERALGGPAIATVRERYRYWREQAAERIDATAAQFPEFVAAMQERLAGRLLLTAERHAIERECREGTLPPGDAHELLGEVAGRIEGLRGGDITKLQFEPAELLRKVPLFRDLTDVDFAQVVACLHVHTVPDGEAVVVEGERDDSMYLIGRGVVRVSRRDGAGEHDVARLFAGDFFGEMALLHRAPRTATCRAATPCALYELRRADFDALCARRPEIRAQVESVDRERRAEEDSRT